MSASNENVRKLNVLVSTLMELQSASLVGRRSVLARRLDAQCNDLVPWFMVQGGQWIAAAVPFHFAIKSEVAAQQLSGPPQWTAAAADTIVTAALPLMLLILRSTVPPTRVLGAVHTTIQAAAQQDDDSSEPSAFTDEALDGFTIA